MCYFFDIISIQVYFYYNSIFGIYMYIIIFMFLIINIHQQYLQQLTSKRMQPQINPQSIIKTDNYELSTYTQEEQLHVRLIINLSKSRNDIYELKMKSLSEFNHLVENFTSINEFRQYILEPDHVEVDLDKKNILVLEISRLKGKKKIQIASLPLQFVKITNNAQSKVFSKILMRLENKRGLTGNEIRESLEDIAVYLQELYYERKKNQQIYLQTEIRIQNIQKNLKIDKQEIYKKFGQQQKTKKNNNQQLINHMNKLIKNTKQQLSQKFMKKKVQINFLGQKNKQISQINLELSKNIENKLKLQYLQISDKLNKQADNIKKNILDVGRLTTFLKKLKPADYMAFEKYIDQLALCYSNQNKLIIRLCKGLKSIPEQLCQIPQIQKLQLQNQANSYLQIQKRKGHCKINYLQRLPDSFRKFNSLKYLKFDGCIVGFNQQIIRMLENLRYLQQLVVCNCPIILVWGLDRLKSLYKLAIYQTDLTCIPYLINPKQNNSNIRILCLNNNQITRITNQIRVLSHLQQLNLSNNQLHSSQIEYLMKDLTKANCIKKLELICLKLKEIPIRLFQLTTLEYLDLSWNQFDRVPDLIGNLKNLETLYLSTLSPLLNLPTQIKYLRKLKRINVSYAKLQKFPVELCSLILLQSIILQKNNIRQLPAQIDNLQNLTLLNISRNKLTQIPKFLKRLPKTVKIILQGNPIENYDYDD